MIHALAIIKTGALIISKVHDLIKSGAADQLLEHVRAAIDDVHVGIDALHKKHVRKGK